MGFNHPGADNGSGLCLTFLEGVGVNHQMRSSA